MSRYTITPWRSQVDLLEVRDQLYASDDAGKDVRRKAVNRVMAWKLRGNLPHAVESTALLVEAIHHHDINTNSIFSIRAVYSAAFTRFVTGFCDIGRHKERTLEPSSMLDIAKQIGMPVEFVALRHEATHEELPGIQRLVSATQQALEWLWKVYWSRLEEPEDEQAAEASLAVMKTDAGAVLREFRRAKRDALRANKQISAGQPGDVATTSVSCVEMCNGRHARIEALARVLVEDRLILPTNRELNSSLDGAYLIWDDLLVAISSKLQRFLPALVASLLHILTSSTRIDPARDVDKEAYAMWLLHVLRSSDFLLAGRADQNAMLADVMKSCCLHPGHWTQHIGRKILEECDESIKTEWEDLFEASLIRTDEEAVEEVLPRPDPSYPQDVAERIDINADIIDTAGGWSKAVAPTSVPIGVVQ